jgi:type IV pilus assembly protein PilM
MLETLFTSPIISIEVDNHKLKIAQISIEKGKAHIQNLKTFIVASSSETDVNPLYINQKQTLPEAFSQSLSISSVPASEILIRSLDIKLTKERDVKEAIPFQIEPLLPFPLEHSLLQSMIVKKAANSTLVNVFALRKDLLQQHLDSLRSFQLDPENVSCSQAALAAFAKHLANANVLGRPTAIIHIGFKETLCVISCDGVVLASHAFNIGGSTLAKSLANDKNLSFEKAEAMLRDLDLESVDSTHYPTLQQTLDALRMEIAKSLFALTKQCKIQHIVEILLTGEGSLYPQMSETLSRSLNATLSTPKQQGNYSSQTLQEYAIAIGLALTLQPSNRHPINFRQGDLAYPDPWKRLKKPLIAYFSLCCLVAASLYLFGMTWLSYQEDKLKEGYTELLSTMDKPYKTFEKELLSKKMRGEVNDDDIPSLSNMTQEELLFRLGILQKEIQSSPDLFPLHPNVPRVSDVLAWLSTHPNVVIGKDDTKNPKAALKIESLTYTMVKRPEQNKKQEKYQVRVELEFTAETPKLAREFHDALIAPNDMIAPKSEIKWNTAPNNRYRTSFILKDKTGYISG